MTEYQNPKLTKEDEAELFKDAWRVVESLEQKIKTTVEQELRVEQARLQKAEAERPQIDTFQREYAARKIESLTNVAIESKTVIEVARQRLNMTTRENLTRMLDQLISALRTALSQRGWIWAFQDDDEPVAKHFKQLSEDIVTLTNSVQYLVDTPSRKGWCSTDLSAGTLMTIQQLEVKLTWTVGIFCTFFTLRPLATSERVITRLPTTIFQSRLDNQAKQNYAEMLTVWASNFVPEPLPPIIVSTMPEQKLFYIKPQQDTSPVKINNGMDDYVRGLNYLYGYEFTKSIVDALRHLRLASDKGIPQASLVLGKMYLNGEGVEQDSIEALKYFSKAAQLGSKEAMFLEGQMYEKGRGVPKDVSRAQNLYIYAMSEQGSEPCYEAMYAYAKLIESSGDDFLKAVEFYIEASNKGNLDAKNSVGLLYAKGKIPGIPKAEADIKAAGFISYAAKRGHTAAQRNYGILLMNGQGVDKSKLEAKHYFEKAAQKDDFEAIFHLGFIIYEEATINESQTEMFKANSLFRRALALNPEHSEVNYYLGCMLEYGHGGSKDLVLAAYHYEKAYQADSQNSKALYRLGRVYLTGRGVDKADKQTALNYLSKAGELGNPNALIFLGDLCKNGVTVECDPLEAMKHYGRAAQMKSEKAMVRESELFKAYPQLFSKKLYT